jgi:hypothetical protein
MLQVYSIFVAVSVAALFIFSLLINTDGYAQQVSTNKKLLSPINNDTVSTSKTTPSLSATAANKLHAVKIISPTKNQQVPIGKDLTISGTSIDNLTSSCQVSVIVNSIKPYQPATATGTAGGASDYSKWNFILTSKYTTIKQGPNNKITAKYSCINNPSVVSYSSVNVTGVTMTANTTGSNSITASAASPIKQQQQQVVTKGNNSSEGNSTTASTLPTSHSTKLTYLGIGDKASSTSSPPGTQDDKLVYLGISKVTTHRTSDANRSTPTEHAKSMLPHDITRKSTKPSIDSYAMPNNNAGNKQLHLNHFILPF